VSDAEHTPEPNHEATPQQVSDDALVAAANQALPGKADVQGWRRMHPLSPLLRGGITLFVVIGVIVVNLRDQIVYLLFGQGDEFESSQEYGIGMLFRFGWLVVLGAVLLVVLIVVAFSWVSWRFATFRIADGNVELRQGVLSRKQRRAPLTRIQGVNIQRPLLARIFGLAAVDVQTADVDGNVKLAYLSYQDAKTVRAKVLQTAEAARQQQRSGSASTQSATAVTSAAGMNQQGHAEHIQASTASPAHPDNSAMRAAPTSHTAEVLGKRVDEFLDADVDESAIRAHSLVRVPIGRLILSTLLNSGFLITFGVVIALVVFSFVMEEPAIVLGGLPMIFAAFSIAYHGINRGWAFTISPAEGAVRLGGGLSATTTETLPLKRIHAVELYQPLFWRVFGWWKVRITTPGLGNPGQNSNSAAIRAALPVGKLDDAIRVLVTLLPGIADADTAYEAATGGGSGWLATGKRSLAVTWFAKRRIGARFTSDGDAVALELRGGGLSKKYAVLPVLRMQSVGLVHPLLHRLLGLARVQVHTVPGYCTTWIRGLAEPDARQLFEDTSAAIVRAQLEDAESRYNEQLARTGEPL
jgi:putative membrane protein